MAAELRDLHPAPDAPQEGLGLVAARNRGPNGCAGWRRCPSCACATASGRLRSSSSLRSLEQFEAARELGELGAHLVGRHGEVDEAGSRWRFAACPGGAGRDRRRPEQGSGRRAP